MKGKEMRIIILAILIMIVPILASGSEAINEMPPLNIDSDTLTPSQIHRLEASAKAGSLDSQREKSAVQRITFFDQSEYDVEYYSIKISIDLENEYVDSACVTVRGKSMIDGLDTLELDFVDSLQYVNGLYYPPDLKMTVDSVFWDGGRLNFEHHNNKLIVELDHPRGINEEFSFSVKYHGLPFSIYQYGTSAGRMNGDGLAFGKQRALYGSESGIRVAYTNCEPYDSRKWWPCKDRPDDKADSMDIFVMVDEPYYCASNGELVNIEPCQGNPTPRIFHYKVGYPIVTYLVSLAISDYTVWSDWYYYGDNDSMEIVNHVYPELYDASFEPLSVTPIAIGVLSDLFTQYPFITEKYGHAHWEVFADMEHQTCTSALCDTWGTSEAVVVHELAHQWWGDMITCKSWHDIWLNEGFASYSEALYYESRFGREYYHDYMMSMEYLDDRSVYVYDTTRASDVFDIVVYDKGAWVLHMLRHVIGDETFFNFLHEYANSQYRHSSLTTQEFMSFINNLTGQNLDEFFNDWVYGILYPVYGSAYYSIPDLSDGQYWIFYNILQTQTYGPEVFDMPLDLRFYDGTNIMKDTTVLNNSNQQMYLFKVPSIPDSIVIDPDNWILNKGFSIPWGYHLLPLPLAGATQYGTYLDTIICHGGSGHNHFQIVSGALPSGLELNSVTGILTGFPVESGAFSFTVRVDDDFSSYSDDLEYAISVSPGTAYAGDSNLDTRIDILDIVYLINYKYKDGPEPLAAETADPNADCNIDILDIVYLLNFKYKNGPDPLMGCATL